MWELDYKESWAPKNWCFWTLVLEKTLESPLDCKEIQPIYPKGDHSWVFIWRTDAKAETPVLWPPHAKSWLIGKDSDAGRDWEQEEKGTTGWDAWSLSKFWELVMAGRPGVLQSIGLQTVGHDWVTELSWTKYEVLLMCQGIYLMISTSACFLPSPFYFLMYLYQLSYCYFLIILLISF